MKYVGIQTQIWHNNRNTAILLFMYPVIILAMVFSFIYICDHIGIFCSYYNDYAGEGCAESAQSYEAHWPIIGDVFLKALPWTLAVVTVWFLFAYLFNTSLIRQVTHAKPLERKENLRVYNMVENLCIEGDIEMPQINIIYDSGLNAFASGIDIKTYTITLTTGIIDKLNDDELRAVIAHELTHIKNRDTRLMVVCIVFVGLISLLQTMFWEFIKGMLRGCSRRSRGNKKEGGVVIAAVLFLALIGLAVTTVAYFFSYVNRLAISRKREYVADAGAAELCGDPLALANALRKVSLEPGLSQVKRNDVAQLYIVHPDEEGSGMLSGLVKKANIIFSTHPDTLERIQILEQF